MRTVGIIDYGMGNLLSVFNALEIIGADARICSQPSELFDVDQIILPGVGAFGDCMTNLEKKGFIKPLNRLVLEKRKPIMGICLGMQVMARRSFEGGEFKGLGWFDAEVVRIQPSDKSLRVPQIGWNDITCKIGPLFLGLPERPDFYFVHSYHMSCSHQDDIQATCMYGDEIITAAVLKNNIFATQFHPEKSQDYGLRLLENFLAWNP